MEQSFINKLAKDVLAGDAGYYSASEASRQLGIDLSTLLRWVKTGKIRGHYKKRDPFKGPRWVINKDDIHDLASKMVTHLDDSGWLSVDAASKLLGITYHKMLKLLEAKKIDGVELPWGSTGRTWRINRNSLATYMNEQKIKGALY